MEKQKASVFIKIRNQVAKIPKGKVSTYGDVARAVGLCDVRKVGWALHQNKDSSDCPCHRVVNKEGRVSPGYVFGGGKEQKKKLLLEGVTFKDETHVDLQKHSFHLVRFN